MVEDPMNDINVTRWPVFILGNYRSGSNLLGRHIAHCYNAKWLNEPTRGGRLADFLEFYKTGNKHFVLKVMPDQLGLLKEVDETFASDCFKIKIQRKNTIDQIVSHYISTKTNTWVQRTKNTEPYSVECIDYKILNWVANVIDINNKYLDTTDTNFDYSLFYEDLDISGEEIDFYKISKPTNFEEIYKEIQKWYIFRLTNTVTLL